MIKNIFNYLFFFKKVKKSWFTSISKLIKTREKKSRSENQWSPVPCVFHSASPGRPDEASWCKSRRRCTIIWNRSANKITDLYSTGLFIIAPYSIYFCSSPPARESKPKPPWHRTEVCTGVPRYTLPQVVNLDTSNRYPPAHPPDTRPFLDCRRKKSFFFQKIFLSFRNFYYIAHVRKFCVNYRITKSRNYLSPVKILKFLTLKNW